MGKIIGGASCLVWIGCHAFITKDYGTAHVYLAALYIIISMEGK
jgi:hypothetical protein